MQKLQKNGIFLQIKFEYFYNNTYYSFLALTGVEVGGGGEENIPTISQISNTLHKHHKELQTGLTPQYIIHQHTQNTMQLRRANEKDRDRTSVGDRLCFLNVAPESRY